jgi:hypothetical protein
METPRSESLEKISDLIVQRREKILKLDLNLKTEESGIRGTTSVVYRSTYNGIDEPLMLKVSGMEKGIGANEIEPYRTHISGIPLLRKTYEKEGVTTALLLEEIPGEELDSYLQSHDGIAKTLLAMRRIIESFHAAGFRMPSDWMKSENWKVTAEGRPYLIDLGESRPLIEHKYRHDPKDFQYIVGSDLRSFRHLVERYEPRLARKEKKEIDQMMEQDYYRYRNEIYGGNPDDR